MYPLLKNKTVILGVSGGIAAYKSVELLRGLTKAGADVRVILTANACRFVAPMTFEALSGHSACTTLFAVSDDASIRHIEWAQSADAVVIAPATGNLVAKLAHGIADDALSTFMLAVTAPRMVCPSMNTHMFEHRATQRNLAILAADGYEVLTPGSGQLACGTVGPGRLPDPEEILDRLNALLTPKDLEGRRVLVTAGPTREFFDPVRFVSNPSSGKMGFAVARCAEQRGAEVVLVSGPVALESPLNMTVVKVTTALEMAREVKERVDWADLIVKTAAVSDYRPQETAEHKIKKGADEIHLAMVRNPDILQEIGRRKERQVLIGFAAETEALEQNARDKLEAKNLDLIVANNLTCPDAGFGTDTNTVTFFHRDGPSEPLESMSKEEVAHILLDRAVRLLERRVG